MLSPKASAPAAEPIEAPADFSGSGRAAAAASAEFAAVATLAPPAPRAEVAPSAFPEPPVPEAEYEPEPEVDADYPADAEDPEAPPSHMAPARAPEPELAVPVQSSPAALPAVWSALVGEFMASRPLVGAHLLQTRLVWEEGETQGLRLVFLERAAWSLIGEDADFRKTIQAFLASKAEGGKETVVRFSLDPEAAKAGPAVEVPSLAGKGQPKEEPIIGFIQDLFEGRLI
jgi:hypothetical protein